MFYIVSSVERSSGGRLSVAVMGAAGEGENRDNPLFGEEVGILEQICKLAINPTIFLERICPIEILECVYTDVGMNNFIKLWLGHIGNSPKCLLMRRLLSSDTSILWNLMQKEWSRNVRTEVSECQEAVLRERTGWRTTYIYPDQWSSLGVTLTSREHVTMSGDILFWVATTKGWVITGIWWVEARDTANHQ